MALRNYQADNSTEVTPRVAALPIKPDRDFPRLLTALHMPVAVESFRVMAELEDGRLALVSLESGWLSAAAALELARQSPPEEAIRVYLERWAGLAGHGSWRPVRRSDRRVRRQRPGLRRRARQDAGVSLS
jgi:hypothetical protein